MKCPVAVSNTWKSAVDNQPLSKVVVPLDPLRPELPSSLQVIDNDRGVLMRPIPGMLGLIASNSSKQFLKEILTELCAYNKRGTNQGTYELKPECKKTVEDAGAE